MDLTAHLKLPAADRDRYDDAGTGVEADETTEPTVLALAAALLEHPAGHPAITAAAAAAKAVAARNS